ncbi:MAG: hypothetical protein SO004_07465, partial [Blautia sp.]|nr:hypothetical protein [Blautia sp.]
SQGIPEMFEISTNKVHTENRKEKHAMDAEGGWYRFESRFALPVYEANGEIERYNVYHVYLIIRHDRNGKKYLYDIICIYRPDRAHCTAFQCMASADTVHAFRSSVHDDYSGIGIPASVNRASSSSTLSSR